MRLRANWAGRSWPRKARASAELAGQKADDGLVEATHWRGCASLAGKGRWAIVRAGASHRAAVAAGGRHCGALGVYGRCNPARGVARGVRHRAIFGFELIARDARAHQERADVARVAVDAEHVHLSAGVRSAGRGAISRRAIGEVAFFPMAEVADALGWATEFVQNTLLAWTAVGVGDTGFAQASAR